MPARWTKLIELAQQWIREQRISLTFALAEPLRQSKSAIGEANP